MPHRLRLGTRGSLLARTQSQQVAAALMKACPGLSIETILVKTTGDRLANQSLADAGGKGLFTKELELALLARQIDFAVHSLKDVPITMPLVDQHDLTIAAIPKRQDPRDLLVCTSASTLAALPAGAVIGTCSLRRRVQLLAARPDLVIQPLRGNIDTRMQKLDAGQFEAIILARAGVARLDRLDDAAMHPLDLETMLPAAGQGALALQCRRDDTPVLTMLALLNDADSWEAARIEREIVAQLGGDCHSPIAALATFDGDVCTLRVKVGARDGNLPLFDANGTFSRMDAEHQVRGLCHRLISQGAIDALQGAARR